MIITRYKNTKDLDVYFPEFNWTFNNTNYKDFKNGNIKCPYEKRVYGVACIGEGNYKSRDENHKKTKCYITWHTMLERCYNLKTQEKHPSYKNCKVCDEWLNFQNFARWYYENYYEIENERMCLDKDILVKGNKIYSPDTCIFVTNRINVLFTKNNKNRGEYPLGVSYNKGMNKFATQMCKISNGKKIYINLGYYSTPEDAFMTYKTAKEKYIKEVAEEYKDKIPNNLYEAMYNYEVEIDD